MIDCALFSSSFIVIDDDAWMHWNNKVTMQQIIRFTPGLQVMRRVYVLYTIFVIIFFEHQVMHGLQYFHAKFSALGNRSKPKVLLQISARKFTRRKTDSPVLTGKSYTMHMKIHTMEELQKLYTIDIGELNPNVVDVARQHYQTLQTFRRNRSCALHTKRAFEDASRFVDEFYAKSTSKYTSERANISDDTMPCISNAVGDRRQKYVVLDSGCGVGRSSVALAKRFPHFPVIGIDKSIIRLSRNADYRRNARINHQFNSYYRVSGDYATSRSRSGRGCEKRKPEDIEDKSKIHVECEDFLEEPQAFESRGVLRDSPPPNLLLLRAELSDFWTEVAYHSDWIIAHHFLLYPNPYPKHKHLKRRWHGK